jgi:hypothetical protein
MQNENIVNRLTDDKTFRTFFTLYLMAESDAERSAFNERFWRDASALSLQEQQLLRAELTRCFLRLPGMVASLAERVSAAVA